MQLYLVLNGQSAGPFDESQVRSMLAGGQVGADTQCCPVGDQSWRPLGSVLDGVGGAPAGGGMPLAPYGGQTPYGAPPPNNSMAVTSLILACASLLCSCLTSVPAIICGHIALGQIKHSGGTQGGRGLALAGLIVGYIMTGLVLLYVVFIVIFGVYSASNSGS